MNSCCDTYCTNYGCNQGRDCPVRATPVARIGRKDYTREALPPTSFKRQLRVLAKWLLIVWSMLVYAVLLMSVLR